MTDESLTLRPDRPADPLAAGMREGVPDERLRSRELKVFGDVEVGRHRFYSGETSYPPLPGHLVNLHLGAPTRVVTRRDDERWEGTQPTGTVEVFSAGKATEQVMEGASEDVSVLLGEGFVRRMAEEVGADPDKIEIFDRFATHDANVERILLSLLPELETEGLGGELYVQSLATSLALHLLRAHSSLGRNASREAGRAPPGRLPVRALRLVTEHVEDNLGGNLSLDEMAAVAGLSSRHFLRLFKASTGTSPYQFVLARRVERARELLSDGDLPLWRVAEACGFAHQQHLSTHFRRLVEVSPGAYRTLSSR